MALFSGSVIHEEKFASRASLSLTNAQRYRYAKHAYLIPACLYALASNLFFVNYWNIIFATDNCALTFGRFLFNSFRTTLFGRFCLDSCIFISLSTFFHINHTTIATLPINFVLLGCFQLRLLKIHATLFALYKGYGCILALHQLIQ